MLRLHVGLSVLAILLLAQLSHAAPPAGLLGHWKFDAGQGDAAEDLSGNGNAAELLGANWAKGAFGAALHFTGKDSFATVPQIAGLDGSNELTVEAWVLWETGGRYPNILSGGQWSPGGFLIFVHDQGCSFRMGRPGPRPGEPAAPWNETSAAFLGKFETGKWYHLAATFKRPVLTTYLNGRKAGSAHWDYPVGYRGDLRIGTWNGGPSCHKGLIDEVKVFSRALSAEEVQASYAAEAPRRTAPGQAAYTVSPAVSEPLTTIENSLATLEIDVRARCTALVEKRSGQNLLANSSPLVTVRVKDKILRPTACSYADGKLSVRFGKDEAKVVIECASKARYLTFTVLSVEGEGVESLSFVSLPLVAGKQGSDTSGAVVGDEWGVCLREMNLQTETSVGGAPCTLRASCSAEYGLVGSKAGLVVAPVAQLRPALLDMVQAEGLPQSSLGGPRALDAEGIRGSYLFAHPSEREVERWIDLAKRGGFTHLHFDGWYKTLGHYEPNPGLFPNGLEGMKTMVRKVHEAGLKAGMHTLTGCISPNDPWVTPVPDKRLAADASYLLAADMDEKSDTILTVEKPREHDIIWSYSGRGNAIRIGEEIIQYSAISFTPPYGFLKCTRGAFKTRPGAHRKGDAADHLRQVYIAFYPDERSTLVGEVAEKIARVYNECQFDQIYMDGSEGMGSIHAIQTMRDAIYKRLKRPAVVEASCWDHWSWYYHSRIGAWDHPKWGLKPFTDMHCASIPSYRQGALLQAQLGWWVVLGPSHSSRAETPDEMEYFCAKTLAFDAPSSTQGIGSPASPANARMQEYLTMAGWYDRLRLANYFAESVTERVRQPGKDFHLVQTDDGQWQLLPADYLAYKVTGLDNGANAWKVQNQFAEQPLKMRLEALYAVSPYDSPDATPLADAANLPRFTVRRAAAGVTQALSRSTDQVKAGGASLCFTATNTGASRQGAWACTGMPFEAPYLSVNPCDAIGMWIHGDGKGEVLNIQLTSPREYMHAYGEHYVKIDFSGWRYVEIPLRERDADKHRDYEWPYAGMGPIYMTPVDTNHIDAVNLYLNNLPPNDTATVYLSPIKALRTVRAAISNPTLDLNGRKLTFPTTLQSGDYVELASMDDCRVYNERGTLLERLSPTGTAPVLKTGENRAVFSCDRPSGLSARAEVTLVAFGTPLAERSPASQINWALLRDQYDLPRVVTKVDGKENRWETICRQDAKLVSCGVEIDVEQVNASDAAYNRPEALTLESFDGPGFFADSPGDRSAETVYDAKVKIASLKAGVTHSIERSTGQVKIGRAAARYTAASTLADHSGWSVWGRRYLKPLDLSKAQAVGFWLHGDGKGEAFKLQLHDKAGGWLDLVTHVDFTGWRYQHFALSGPGNLDRASIQSLLIYYNGIPAGQTVTCYLDDVRAVPALEGLRNPQLTIGANRLVFPVELWAGGRLVYDGVGQCRVYRKAGSEPELIQPQGAPLTLAPGRNPVVLSFGSDALPHFRAAVSLVKHY
jgi:hypothetical protein